MFGSNNNQNTPPTFSFGSSATNNNANSGGQATGFGSASGSGLFGQGNNTTGASIGTGFGQASNTAGAATNASFGSAGFGQVNNPTSNAAGGATAGFGSTGSSLFGQTGSTATPTSNTSTVFGAPPISDVTFGQANNPFTGIGFAFSNTSKPVSSGGGFGAAPTFGQASNPSTGTGFAFSNTSKPVSSGGGFGFAPTSTSAAAATPGLSFGGASNPVLGSTATSQTASGSLFGGAAATPASSATSGFNFGNTTTSTSSAVPASSGTTGFSFNLNPSSQSKPGFGFGSTSGATSATGFGSSLAGASNLSNPPAVLTTTPLSSTPSVPSISGSVQSTIPSLLHKKDMQDILSEWTNEVKNLTDEFLTQANEVSKWDQVVRENTKTINQLISASKECSTFQNNTDSNIEYVLAQQEELNKILDEYEGKIDEKIQAHNLKQQQEGTSYSSADIYRESTMNTANSLAQDLQTVEKQLEDILKETKTYSDQESSQMPETVNQILGILNAHLLALEQLNSNSNELDSKILDLVKSNTQTQPFVHNHSGNASNASLSSNIFPGTSLNNNPHPRSTIQRNFYQAQESLNSQNSFFGGSH